MAVSSDKPVPYATPTAIWDIIDRYRNRGLQKPFNAEVLGRAGVSDGLIARTLQALQILDLIKEDGNPTDTLEGLRKATEADFQKRLAEWIRSAYADVFQFVDPGKDNETAIRDAFRNYEPVGQQPRMVTLFITLCEKAGLREPSAAGGATRRMASGRTSTSRGASGKESKPKIQRVRLNVPPTKRVQLKDQGNLPSAIEGLLKSLPPENGTWTQAERDKFYRTFGSVLDFCYHIGEPAPQQEEEGEDVLS